MNKFRITHAVVLVVLACSPIASATDCDSLRALKLPDTTIVLAERVAAGAFTPPKTFPVPFPPAGAGARLPVVALADLPEFCRVAGVIKPSADSEIKFEVWMPAANWNGKFWAVGNGGAGGYVNYPFMTKPLFRGFATASTDTGHEQRDWSFVLGHPERLTDFAYTARSMK